MKEMWESRFSEDNYVYGKEPNQFFKEEVDKLQPATALFVGEGEGRNSVYAASKGWNVDATDWSENARKKALNLAKENNVSINYSLADFESLSINKKTYDLIVLIFIHVEEQLRKSLHEKAFRGLKSGGHIILESYEIDQLKFKSGGPKTTDLLYTLEDIYTDFNEMEIVRFSKDIVPLQEGPLHQGDASVIRFVGKKND